MQDDEPVFPVRFLTQSWSPPEAATSNRTIAGTFIEPSEHLTFKWLL